MIHHGTALGNAEAIVEVRRILHQHLQDTNGISCVNCRILLGISLQLLLSLLILAPPRCVAPYYQLPLTMPWLAGGLLFWAAVVLCLVRLWRTAFGTLYDLSSPVCCLIAVVNSLTPSNNHQCKMMLYDDPSRIEGDQSHI